MKISAPKSKARTECDKILNYVKSTASTQGEKTPITSYYEKKLKSGYFRLFSDFFCINIQLWKITEWQLYFSQGKIKDPGVL